jgi:hypothetical protein
MERFYISESKKYTGTIVGEGKFAQCLLDNKSKRKLASENLKSIRKQNKPR